MEIKNPKSHVTLVAALHIGFGVLAIIGGIIVFFVLNFVTGFVEEYDEIGVMVMTWITTFVPLLLFFFGGIDVLAGILLFTYKPGARIFMLIVSAINCLDIPFGTARGVYSIWALMQPQVMEMFDPEKRR